MELRVTLMGNGQKDELGSQVHVGYRRKTSHGQREEAEDTGAQGLLAWLEVALGGPPSSGWRSLKGRKA